MTTQLSTAERPVRLLALRKTINRWDVKVSPYLYISPFFILFTITGLFPLLYTAYVSLHDWSIIGGQGDFVGFDNFSFVLGRPEFWVALRNTLSIFVISTVPQLILALIIAAVLDSNLRASTFWRMGVLLPYVVTPVAIAIVFSLMFSDKTGIVNLALTNLGLDPVRWHAEIIPSHFAIAQMVNFRWTGYNALIFLAAMQAIPRDYYEAAMIDGASRLRRFWSITIPQLRPTVIFVAVTSTIGGMQIFDEPRLFDNFGRGGSDGQWRTLTIYIYDLGWTQQNFGRAAAVAWLLFLLIVIFAVINLMLTRAIATTGTKVSK
jgi:cellobiose transport system permease protein